MVSQVFDSERLARGQENSRKHSHFDFNHDVGFSSLPRNTRPYRRPPTRQPAVTEAVLPHLQVMAAARSKTPFRWRRIPVERPIQVMEKDVSGSYKLARVSCAHPEDRSDPGRRGEVGGSRAFLVLNG